MADRAYESVLELGCGDGNQLRLAEYPNYVGADGSKTAIELCQKRFADDRTKEFVVAGAGKVPTCELGISLDVIYHLVEDDVFENYMDMLVRHSTRSVILYSSDLDWFAPELPDARHIKRHHVCRWMDAQKNWQFVSRTRNQYPYVANSEGETSFANWYIYDRIEAPSDS